jgi:hypothetical protein
MVFFMCNCKEAGRGRKSDSASRSSDFDFDRATNRSSAFPAHSAHVLHCIEKLIHPLTLIHPKNPN